MGQVGLMGNGMKKTGDVLMGFHGVLMGFNGVSMGFNGGFMGDFSCDSSISICFQWLFCVQIFFMWDS